MPPFFSVVIATHERPALLERAIDSVRRQDVADLQIVVVTDVQDAATTSVAARCLGGDDLFVQRFSGPGPARSRNVGVAAATGRYVLFLDDDDSFDANFFADLRSRLGAREDCVYHVDFDVVDEDRSVLPARVLNRSQFSTATATRENVQVFNTIPNNCLVYPRLLLARHCFDDTLILFEDWQFLLSVLRDAQLAHLPLRGPVIHKSDRALGDRRGARNDDRLAETILHIYRLYPAETDAVRLARQNHFRNAGIELAIEYF